MDKLTVDNLSLSYGAFPILKGTSVKVKQGEILVLLGPSGSGKTTLLRAIAGLESPQAGTISVGGTKMFDGAAGLNLPAEKRNLGLVFQSYALWPHRTVFDNVAYGLKLRKVPKPEIQQRVTEALTQLGLGHLAERFPHQLSGGQQQRVAIGRALVYKPPVLLLDEPLSNLDAKLRDEAKAWLRRLIIELQLSAIMVTHDQQEAMAIGDRIVLLQDGMIEQEDSPVDIYNKPRTAFAAEFFGSTSRIEANVVRADGEDTIIRSGETEWRGRSASTLAAGSPVVGIFRTERARLSSEPVDGGQPVTLVQSLFVGDRWEHHLDVKGQPLRAFGPRPLAGEEGWLSVDPSDLWLFPAPASH
jgi:iron(III) transport system ATP-binding protein